MGKFNFTDNEFFKEEESKSSDEIEVMLFKISEPEEALEVGQNFAEEVISEIMEEHNLDNSNSRATVFCVGTIMIVLVFYVKDDSGDDELIDARAIMNLLNGKWEKVPGPIGDWLIFTYLESITDAVDDLDLDDDFLEDDDL